MNLLNNKVVVITGATSGIGKALALQLARPGVQLVLGARRMSELDMIRKECEAKGAACLNLFIDMTSSESISEFCDSILKSFKKVDLLINNAGISQRSQAAETSMEVDRMIMETNFFGHIDVSKQLWPLILKSPHANIVLISSVVGTFGFPQRSAYSASKHALEGFFESWMLENTHENVHFTIVAPGRIKTNISYSALKSDGSRHEVLDEGQARGISAQKCAEKIIRAVEKDKRMVYIAKGEMLLIVLKKYCPFLFIYLVKKLKLS